MKHTKQAFTLIELLVVVLIIGILAAVALPQYQIAVAKSRYATLKNIVQSIAAAQEVYYLSNGAYADEFNKLDIDLPGGKDDSTSSAKVYQYDWGKCWMDINYYNDQAKCHNNMVGLTYTQRFIHSAHGPNTRMCIASSLDANTVANKVCQQETGITGDKDTNYNVTNYTYQ